MGWKQAENDGAQRPDERKNTADFCGFQRCQWMPVDGKLEGSGNREKVANYLNKRLLLPPSSMTEAPAEAPKTNESIGSRHFLGTEVRLVVQR